MDSCFLGIPGSFSQENGILEDGGGDSGLNTGDSSRKDERDESEENEDREENDGVRLDEPFEAILEDILKRIKKRKMKKWVVVI